MQTISERKELRRAVEKWRTHSVAPHSGFVSNKPAISQPADLASEIGRQTNERSVNDTDRVASRGFAAGLVILLAILYALAWFAPKL